MKINKERLTAWMYHVCWYLGTILLVLTGYEACFAHSVSVVHNPTLSFFTKALSIFFLFIGLILTAVGKP